VTGVLIVGCGDIGRRVAALYQSAGVPVTGLVRSAESAAALAAAGIEPLRCDLDAEVPAALPAAGLWFWFAPPPGRGTTDTRLRRFLAGVRTAPRRVLLISTTGVYGDSGGAWIDESAPVAPGSDRGRRRLDAERTLTAWAAARGVETVVLRVPGIYGPGRLPLARLRAGTPLLRPSEAPWTNRIHQDDLATACQVAMAHAAPGSVINACDGHPGNMTEYFLRIADHFGIPHPPLLSRAEAERVLSPGMLSYLRESRRICNDRLLALPGMRLRYPDLAAGLAAIDPRAGALA